MNWWREGLAGVRDIFYPPLCVVCGAARPEWGLTLVCQPCANDLPRLGPPCCQVCGEMFTGRIDGEFQCSNCAGRRFDFDFATAPCRAEGQVRELIHRFKYDDQIHLRQPLGELLLESLAQPRLAAEPRWHIVPVPLHSRRFRERAFNQSRELAVILSRHTGFPLCDTLRRTRYTTVQARLHRSDRLTNLKNAFDLSWREKHFPRLKNEAVLLLDDVFTTGATSQECARLLKKKAGVRRVVVLTVARG